MKHMLSTFYIEFDENFVLTSVENSKNSKHVLLYLRVLLFFWGRGQLTD